MKKILALVILYCLTLSVYSQDKIAIIAKAGYAGIDNGKLDGIGTGFDIGYLFHERMTVLIGVTSLTSNTFPNENGTFKTGNYILTTQQYGNELGNDILNQYSNGVVNNYYSFSSISLDLGFGYRLIQASESTLDVMLKINLAEQNSNHLFPEEISNTQVNLNSSVKKYRGVGFTPEIRYGHRIFNSFSIGCYLSITMFNSTYSTSYFDLGLFFRLAI